MDLAFLVGGDASDAASLSSCRSSPKDSPALNGMDSLAQAAAFAARSIADSPISATESRDPVPPPPVQSTSPQFSHVVQGLHECPQCGQCFSQKVRFLHHRYAVHGVRTHSGRAILPCDKCNSAFLRKTDRTKHTACVHERRRPFKCREGTCTSAFFFSKDLLKHHSTVHERCKPFACTLCDSKFGKREHMTSHIRRVHEKRKPFGCDICNIRLASKYNLQGHLRTASHASAARALGLTSTPP